jgi:ethanolamine utilization protein EutQ (cupin superfamily)
MTAEKSILHFKKTEMSFSEGALINGNSGAGHFSACRLVTLDNSKTLCSGVTTYDGCSIESTMKYDEIFIVLEGLVRILWGPSYSRVVEAKIGDVVWLPKGNSIKYEGEKGKIFYTLYPVDWRAREEESVSSGAVVSQVRLIKVEDMAYEPMFPEAGGSGTRCRLLTPDMSTTVGASMHTYDNCSIEWTTHYDQATIVLQGTLRIVTGENFNEVIEAGVGDVIRLPNGTHFKYEGENAKTFTALYPIDWATHPKT